ncbi:MAG: hypothetical protein H6553_01085 [Chitinophagales bacterium]|nr:hypothetical protein [Chitinophagales bacterium]
MKKIFLKFSILLFASLVSFVSCKKDYEPVVSNTVEMSGSWWVKLLYLDNGEYRDLYADFGYGDIWGELITSNTASNDKDSLWIIDHDLWDFQSKVNCDISNLTFSNSNAISIVEDYEIATPISNGKVLKSVAVAPSGHITDSIVMDIEFEDFPGYECRITGYKRTGWPEDDH